MNPEQRERATDLINMIERRVEISERHNGFSVVKPGGTQIGHVRFNIQGKDKGRFRVYAYSPFFDPQHRFHSGSKSSTRGWTYVFGPEDQSALRYTINVLESSYDSK